MKIRDVRELASKKELKVEKLDKLQLIEKTERSSECFATPHVLECRQMNCLWREDC